MNVAIKTILPYSRQSIDEDDIAAVVDVLRSDWLTTGPKVLEFEQAFARFVGAREAVAVSSGTAALHAAMFALGIGPGDEVVVPAITFAATANCVVFCGGTPAFADVDPHTLLLNPAQAESKITPRTKAIIAVDYAGQPCDYDALREITSRHSLALVDDACHALGATYQGRCAGVLADLNTFSFHPVKHITTGEGGIITTDNPELAKQIRGFRNHGITTDHRQRDEQDSWFYEMVGLGFNYRISDFQCALGLSQLAKLPGWITRRQQIAAMYDDHLANVPGVKPLTVRAGLTHAYHLYVVRVSRHHRGTIFSKLRTAGIGVNVHYIPVYWHPYYQQRGYQRGLCPVADAAYEQLLSLPIFPTMTDEDVNRVVCAVQEAVHL